VFQRSINKELNQSKIKMSTVSAANPFANSVKSKFDFANNTVGSM